MSHHEDANTESDIAVLDDPAIEDLRRRNDAVMRLLDEWMADESGYDEETWPLLKEALNQERERVGARKLFRD